MTNLIAQWPAPKHICALTTTRTQGASMGAFASNNLALHVGDHAEHVQKNRDQLSRDLLLPNEPAWLNQTHSNRCVVVEDEPQRNADAAITRSAAYPLAIMTADCLPIVLCDQAGSEIAAIHAGWRGLLNGIVENTLDKMRATPDTLMAWIGPAICKRCYETGEDVREAYTRRYPFTEAAFHRADGRLYADLPRLAELILHASGVLAVYQSGACTNELNKTFYSYRHNAETGRMATLIWFHSPITQDLQT